MKTIEPDSFDQLLDLLQKGKEPSLFRGQSPENRILHCTLARELRSDSPKIQRNLIPAPPLKHWTISGLHEYHNIIFNAFILHEDVLRPLNGDGDPFFELVRHLQQNSDNPKIISLIPQKYATPAIEFSEKSEIALFFAVKKPEKDGAIFRLNRNAIGIATSFKQANEDMKINKDASPCIVYPSHQLRDLDDAKPERQAAIYVFQRDLRYTIDHYLEHHIEKIVVKRSFYPAVNEFLASCGVTEDYVYARA